MHNGLALRRWLVSAPHSDDRRPYYARLVPTAVGIVAFDLAIQVDVPKNASSRIAFRVWCHDLYVVV